MRCKTLVKSVGAMGIPAHQVGRVRWVAVATVQSVGAMCHRAHLGEVLLQPLQLLLRHGGACLRGVHLPLQLHLHPPARGRQAASQSASQPLTPPVGESRSEIAHSLPCEVATQSARHLPGGMEASRARNGLADQRHRQLPACSASGGMPRAARTRRCTHYSPCWLHLRRYVAAPKAGVTRGTRALCGQRTSGAGGAVAAHCCGCGGAVRFHTGN
jgi:hypothetical protein